MISSTTLHLSPGTANMNWVEFIQNTPDGSIALDGFVNGISNYNPTTRHFNFDHHDEHTGRVTMSTANQVFMAIKSGILAEHLASDREINVYANHLDEDVALALWLLKNFQLFKGINSIPLIENILQLDGFLDSTGGVFPLNPNNSIVRTHAWIFQGCSDVRQLNGRGMSKDNLIKKLDQTLIRLDRAAQDKAGQIDLELSYEILARSDTFVLVEGGSHLRIALAINNIPNAVILNHTINKQYYYSIISAQQPLAEIYLKLNKAEGKIVWGGTNGFGGVNNQGSKLPWDEIAVLLNKNVKDAQ